MAATNLPEVWLRGPLSDIPPLLQPVAHTLMQAQEEIQKLLNDFPEDKLWTKPAALASPAFHLQHIAGVLDRLFTYAKGESLSEEQFSQLKAEGVKCDLSSAALVEALSLRIQQSLDHLKTIDENTLTETRSVGRVKLPSTVLGLLFHSAEHSMRHLGQLLVTVNILKAE